MREKVDIYFPRKIILIKSGSVYYYVSGMNIGHTESVFVCLSTIAR